MLDLIVFEERQQKGHCCLSFLKKSQNAVLNKQLGMPPLFVPLPQRFIWTTPQFTWIATLSSTVFGNFPTFVGGFLPLKKLSNWQREMELKFCCCFVLTL